MPNIQSVRLLPYPAADIYALVMGLEHYPDILSYIRAVRVLEQSPTLTLAEVTVAAGPMAFSYVSRITTVANESIDIVSVSGPFKHLQAHWRFAVLSEYETRVSYALNAQFESMLMEAVAGRIFAQQMHQAMAAFEARLRKS